MAVPHRAKLFVKGEIEMLRKRYVIIVEDGQGNLVQLFGNTVEPKDKDIENCLDSCREDGGLCAFVDVMYEKVEEQE